MELKVKIGDKFVGEGEPTFIIAEAGSNHNQNKDQAKKLIDMAARAKVDAVKFQLFKADILYPDGGSVHDAVKKNEFPRDWVQELFDYTKTKGLTFLASAFDRDAVNVLNEVGVLTQKIASSEITNFDLIRYAASKKTPLLISTGMCDWEDVEDCLTVLREINFKSVVLFQCTTLYPLEAEHVHLNVIPVLRNRFKCPVGFSDHTMKSYLPAVAVGLGANVIEKHFTLNRGLSGPDHGYALEPDELKMMVDSIRFVEKALGSKEKKLLPEEAVNARRDSIWAAQNMKEGERITKEKIVIRRPALGIRPRHIDKLLGQSLSKNVKKGDPLTWGDVILKNEKVDAPI